MAGNHNSTIIKYRDFPPPSSRIEVLWELLKKGEVWWTPKFSVTVVLIENVLAVGATNYDQLLSYERESPDG